MDDSDERLLEADPYVNAQADGALAVACRILREPDGHHAFDEQGVIAHGKTLVDQRRETPGVPADVESAPQPEGPMAPHVVENARMHDQPDAQRVGVDSRDQL